jgi:hypothetical protein
VSLSRDGLNERILKDIRRTEFRLRQRIEYYKWQEEFLFKEIEALKANRSVLGLPDGMAFEFVLESNAPADPPKTSDTE